MSMLLSRANGKSKPDILFTIKNKIKLKIESKVAKSTLSNNALLFYVSL